MENKINIAEILKNCEKGMELDCILFKDTPAYFHGVITETNYPIEIKVEYPSKELETFFLNKYGAIYDRPTAKCVIFPKGKTTWEGFVPPCKFKEGDVVVSVFDDIHLLRTEDSSYCAYRVHWTELSKLDNTITTGVKVARLATEEEKNILFDAIKENGYKWNPETKTLEKLPKFKVGDRVRNKNYKDYIYDIHDITDKGYRAKEINADSPIIILFGSQENNYELVPDKFDVINFEPFMKVLVRSDNSDVWECDFFSLYNPKCSNRFHCIGAWYNICIPYIGNEHLLGTTDDCNEFYKNW